MCCPKDPPMFPEKISESPGPGDFPVEDEVDLDNDLDDDDDDNVTEMIDALSQPIYSTGGEIVTIL